MTEKVRRLLADDDADGAIALLEEYRSGGGEMDDTLFYLLGNAWRKRGDWRMAMNNYLEALELNPESPAREALAMAQEILAFFNKDMYNH